MSKEFWLSKWQRNDIPFNQPEPNPFLVEYCNQFNLKPNSRIFVPLCGKSIDMLWLAKKGHEIIGVELSLTACEQFFKENDLPYTPSQLGPFEILKSEKITLLAGDFFVLTKDLVGKIDFVYDRAALFALPHSLRIRYAQMLTQFLSLESKMLIVTVRFDETIFEGPPFSVDEKEIRALFGSHFEIQSLYEQKVKKIADHLYARGLREAWELVFSLTPVYFS